MSNTPDWLMDGLKQIANGLPTRTASDVAKGLLGKLDAAFAPAMNAPKLLEYAFDMPEPWQPVIITFTGQRAYRHPDGRMAIGITSATYHEFFHTRFMPLAHSLVHAGGFLYMEADSEEALVRKAETFDINYKEMCAERTAPPTIKRVSRRKAS